MRFKAIVVCPKCGWQMRREIRSKDQTALCVRCNHRFKIFPKREVSRIASKTI